MGRGIGYGVRWGHERFVVLASECFLNVLFHAIGKRGDRGFHLLFLKVDVGFVCLFDRGCLEYFCSAKSC